MGLFVFYAFADASANFFYYSSLYAISSGVGGGGITIIVFYGLRYI
jgi:hypothetical protein